MTTELPTDKIDEILNIYGAPKATPALFQLHALLNKNETQEMAIKDLTYACDVYRAMITSAIKTGNRVSP